MGRGERKGCEEVRGRVCVGRGESPGGVGRCERKGVCGEG